MILRLGEDEFVLRYLSLEDDRLGGSIFVELPAREYADYKRVQNEFDEWQRRLAELHKTHGSDAIR